MKVLRCSPKSMKVLSFISIFLFILLINLFGISALAPYTQLGSATDFSKTDTDGLFITQSGATTNNTYNNITNNNYYYNTTFNSTQFDEVNPAHINETWLDSVIDGVAGLYCKLTGCTMQGTINMSNNDIIEVRNLTANGRVTFQGGTYIGNGLDEKQPIIDIWNSNVTHPYLEYDNNFIGSGCAGASWVSSSKPAGFASRSTVAESTIASWSENLTAETSFLIMNTNDLTNGSGWLLTKRADQDNRFVLEYDDYGASTSLEALSIDTNGKATMTNNLTVPAIQTTQITTTVNLTRGMYICPSGTLILGNISLASEVC